MNSEIIEHYMKEVVLGKSASDDVNTQTSCVIINKVGDIVSRGSNTLPTGIKRTPERCSRPDKRKWLLHAERKGIYTCAKKGISTNGCTMFLMWFPCSDCARGIIESGISTLVCNRPDLEMPTWGDDFKVSLEMLEESSVEIIYMD